MFRLALLTLALIAAPAPAADPPADPAAALAAVVRPLILANLPEPLTASERNWGAQRTFPAGVTWRGGRPEVQRAARNDGHWQRMHATAVAPAETFTVAVERIANPEPGRTTFDAVLGLDVRGEHESQVWKAGARLLGTTTVARCHATARLACEVTSRVELAPGKLVPAAVVRVRVTAAEVGYTDFVCEQVVGLHGKPARVTGDAVKAFVNRVRPDLERRLLDKANAAVVAAADTREVRVELDKLLVGRSPVGGP